MFEIIREEGNIMNEDQAHEFALAYAQSSFSQLRTNSEGFSITMAEKKSEKNVAFFLKSYKLAYDKFNDSFKATEEEIDAFLENFK